MHRSREGQWKNENMFLYWNTENSLGGIYEYSNETEYYNRKERFFLQHVVGITSRTLSPTHYVMLVPMLPDLSESDLDLKSPKHGGMGENWKSIWKETFFERFALLHFIMIHESCPPAPEFASFPQPRSAMHPAFTCTGQLAACLALDIKVTYIFVPRGP